MTYVEKVNRCKNVLRDSYMKSNIITKVVETSDYNDSYENLEFINLGIHTYIPKEWFTRTDIYPDVFFMDIGKSIAIGEEKYLLKQILENREVKRDDLHEVTYKEVITKLFEVGDVTNVVLFIPIDYFVKIHVDWARETGRPIISMNKLQVGERQVDIFWSSKYVEFNDFIIVRKSFGRWIAKPSVDSRLKIEIEESRERMEKMELKAQTTFYYYILEPEHILILTPRR